MSLMYPARSPPVAPWPGEPTNPARQTSLFEQLAIPDNVMRE